MDVAASPSFHSSSLTKNPALLSSSCQPFLLPHGTLVKQAALGRALRRHLRSTGPPCPAAHAHNSGGSSPDAGTDRNLLDRRQLLLQSGSAALGMVAAAGAPAPHSAMASPVQFPDLQQCITPIDPGNGAASVSCCLPVSTSITDFKFPSNLPLRTRPSAYDLSSSYIAKYKQAYTLLRQLPASDPRAYMQQANVHCAFCDAAYDANGTKLEYQVHNSWFFFPWHRWYLYFHERILASLIQDNSFALPFWNWDAQSGFILPPVFNDSRSSLYDANRNPLHNPPTPVDLNFNFTEANRTAAAQLQVNNTVMYRQVVTGAKTPSLFFGGAYRQGDAPSPGQGTVENVPHGTVHVWTGKPANPNDEDMGALYSAARDAIFFAHHSNIDRLWEVWKGLGGRRTDLSDPDYLNASFLFYDENAKLVRVRIGDALDISKLGYKYQEVPNAWITASPTRTSSTSATAMSFGPAGTASAAPAMAAGNRKEKYKKFKAGLTDFKDLPSKKLDQKLSVLVKRPRKVRADDFDEEILVLEGVTVAADEKIKFDLYINLAEEDEGTLGSEYAGSFVNVPHMGMEMGSMKSLRKSNFRIGIGDVLKELDIEDDDDLAITLVPRCLPSVAITLDNVRIEYE